MLAPLKRATLINLSINLLVSFLPRVDIFAHLGGGVVGAVLIGSGMLIPPRPAGSLEKIRPFAERSFIELGAVLISAVMLIGTIWAIGSGEAWKIVRPISWVRVYLGESGLSLEVPTIVGGRVQHITHDNVDEYVMGNIEWDPLVVDVSVVPIIPPLLESKIYAREFQKLKSALRTQMPDTYARRKASVAYKKIDGLKTIEESFIYPNGLELIRWSQLRPSTLITLHVLFWPNAPEDYGEKIYHLLTSFEPHTLRNYAFCKITLENELV
jgi:hypothetical protein